MKRHAWILVAILGCSSRDSSAPPAPAPALVHEPSLVADTPYGKDIEKLCDVLARSGADQHEGADRNYLVATWLGANLQTPESRQFLAKIQPLVGEPKAAAIESEAKRVGLASCELANEWRKPPAQ